jgi:CRISPR-associated endoribonuclease Cas2
MRLILFFDLPVVSDRDKRAYTHFLKALKRQGFYMLQYSVYIKLNMDQRAAESSVKQVKEILPKDGYIAVLMVTEKQFASIQYLLGEPDSDVIADDERLVII